MLSEEQVKEIKKQLLKQIESFPEEQRENAKEQIEAMNEKELEQFLIKNKLIKTQSTKQQEKEIKSETECVFCLISQGKIQSYRLYEDKNNLAILEINPLSRGHSLIVPKKHLKEVPSTSFTLAKKIARKIKSKLKPEKVEISVSEFQGHSIINIIPFYKDMPKERKKPEKEELEELREKLKIEKITRVKKTKSEKQLEKAPRRIP